MSAARFVWFELMTTDPQGAKKFYTDVIGWTTKPFTGHQDYEMWSAGDHEIGGVMRLPEEARAAGAPPHWMGYVATANVDDTVKRAQALGGKVFVPGTDIPEVGRFAVLADPQGAAFAVFQAAGAWNPPDMRGERNMGWSELNTTDYKSAWRFYSELFGWKNTSTMDMGPEFGAYFMFGPDEKQAIGGMSDAAKMMNAPAHWLHYVNVKDADATARLVEQKGGKVLNGPMDIPGGGRIAQCMDPQGAMFAFVSSAM